jgi:hypothetical protein
MPIVPLNIRRIQLMLLHSDTYLFLLKFDTRMAKSDFFLTKM